PVSRPREVSLRIVFRMIGTIGLATLMLGMAVGTTAASDVTGHVYVNDNTAGNNTIAGFDRHTDGSLTPIAGSPFAAGGQGTGTLVGSQGALQVSGDGRYLLAADAGSNQISVLRIRPDGTLARVQCSPVYSGCFVLVSIAPRGHLVSVAHDDTYVTNAHVRAGNGSVSALAVAGNGAITSIGTSPYPDGQTAPCWVEISHDGSYLFTVNTGSTSISSYHINADGSLNYLTTTAFKS